MDGCTRAGDSPRLLGRVSQARKKAHRRYDNAMAESFFATLECELLDRVRFRTQSEATIAIFDFIEGFYNPRRRHSALGYLSPIEFERAQAA